MNLIASLKKQEINISKRNKFLEDFDAELVYNQYAKHILNYWIIPYFIYRALYFKNSKQL